MLTPPTLSAQSALGWEGSDGSEGWESDGSEVEGSDPSDPEESDPEEADPEDGPEDSEDWDGTDPDGPDDPEADPEEADPEDWLSDDVEADESEDSDESLDDGDWHSLFSSSFVTMSPTPIVSTQRTSEPAGNILFQLFQTLISYSSPLLGSIATLRRFSSVLSRY
jgi:hypothetical protein